MKEIVIYEKLICFHCGDQCKDKSISNDGKYFCCYGCKTVFELLNENSLCDYYTIDAHPGIKTKSHTDVLSVLDLEEVRNKIISFSNGHETHVTFFLPVMHCSSCIWLLENLQRINKNIYSARVDFLKKQVFISFNESKITLHEVALLLSSIGYEPHLTLDNLSSKPGKKINRKHLYKIGIAGFCFGNIMMMSFPEYFSSGMMIEKDLKQYFTIINLLLSLPVFFYCSSEFFTSAWKGLRQRFLNIDVPIALAIAVTFIRSLYEIISGTGTGYLDSMSGIVFFMLVGRYFQNKTFEAMTFDRNYKSYFPIAVRISEGGKERQKPLSAIRTGDRIIIHNNELIPADAILFNGRAFIDYSFVTGESQPVEKCAGEIIYAGGKHIGERIELEVIKSVSQSYLTELWNKKGFGNKKIKENSFIHAMGKYFTVFVLAASFMACIYWLFHDPSRALNAFTTPLIVACPCALLLSATFTNGTVMRIFGSNKMYLRNTEVIEAMGKVNTIVFDKTGTLTETANQKIIFNGNQLSDYERRMVAGITRHSIHPLSRMINNFLKDAEPLPLTAFSEEPGNGIYATTEKDEIKFGSATFTGFSELNNANDTKVYLVINGTYRGAFLLANSYRKGLDATIHKLLSKFKLSLISGDHDGEQTYITSLFRGAEYIYFNQKPEDKLQRIEELKTKGNHVLMLGDGLNDAGALAASHVGIAVADDINNFSPACDAILDGSQLIHLDQFLRVAADSKKVILASFFISIIYNVSGLFFALQGALAPVIAAVLMPLSSISIILFTTISTTIIARNKGLK